MPGLNAIENVALPLFYRGLSTKERNDKAQNILAELGLAQHFFHRASELSGGQQQRVAIARALVTNPEIILADEPTGNLDSRSGEMIMGLFDELHRKNKTLIVVTHDQNLARRAKRIIMIEDGKIVV